MAKNLKGIITSYLKGPSGGVTGFIIRDKSDPRKEYFAHLGDLQDNENLLYDLRDKKDVTGKTVLVFDSEKKVEVEVEFDTADEDYVNRERVMRVRLPDGD